jgi:hypothetical protein
MAADNISDLKEQLKLLKDILNTQKNLGTAEQKRIVASISSTENLIRKLQKYDGTLDEIQRSQKDLVDGANQFGNAIANLPLGDYLKFEQITEDIASKLAPLQGELMETKSLINDAFSSALPAPNTKEFKAAVNSISSSMDRFKKGAFKGMGADFKKAIGEGDIASFYEKWGEEGRKAAGQLGNKKNGIVGVMNDYFKKDGEATKQLKGVNERIQEINNSAKTFQKITLDTGALWNGIRQNILQNFSLKKIIDQVTDFDNKLANLKKEFQIPVSGFKGASEAMADLTVKGAKFGLSTAESFEMVKTIGDEMKSSNVKNLAEIAQSVAAVPAAMGIASGEVAKITGQLMFFSQNADKVQSSFKNIGKYSGVFGQNATKVAKQFGDAYPKFKMMGMKGNESAIAAMAAQAEKLGINLADSVQSSKNFLDIGEAMEAAADLSLLGGAAAQVSYADLMQARLDPKKMVDIQDKITAGLGKFNKATGEVDFGYSDLVQMEQMAQRLGVSQEVLMKRAKGQREDAAKAAVFDQNMFKGLTPEEKTFLLSKVVSKGGGKFGIEGFDGIKDLKGVSSAQVKAQMAATLQDKKTTEDLAKERASFEETVNRMKGTIMALFNRFQPILQMLTNVLGKVIDVAQGFSNAISKIFGATVGKYVKASIALGAILLLTMGPSAMAKFSGILFRGFASPLKSLSGFGAKLSAAFKGAGGKTSESVTEKIGGATSDLAGKMKGGKAGPTFLQQFAKINPAQILSVAAAIVALGIAFLLIGKGIKLAAEGMATFVSAFKGLNPAQLQAAKSALLGFGIGITVIIGVLAALAFSGVGLAAIGIMLSFGAAMLMIGGGVYLASKGLAYLATSMASIGKNVGSLFKGIGALYALAGALLTISPALLVFGVAGLVAAPGMLALGYLLKGLGAAKGVNPTIIKAVADSMGSMAWGLFKLAGAAVAAPFAILSAKALNYVASAINGLGKIDPAKAISFGMTLTLFANSVAKGLGRLAWMGLGAPLALLAAYSINRISKYLNDIKPVDQKNITAFANSLGKIGIKMAWGLSKLALIAIPAILALPGAKLLAIISNMLNGVKPVNPVNMALFGKSLAQVSGKVLWGLTKLSVVSVLGLAALPGAMMLRSISDKLNGVKPVDEKKMAAFGRSLAQVSGKVLWGLTKLSVVSVVGLLAVPGAYMLNKISNLLNGVKPVNEKNMAAFGKSLSQVTGKVLWGLTKLSVVSVVGLLALPGALMLYKISQYLNAVKPVNEKNMAAFGKSLGKVGGSVMWGLIKLSAVSALGILAIPGAAMLNAISRLLAGVKPVDEKNMAAFGTSLTQIGPKAMLGIRTLSSIAIPSIFASVAAKRIAGISKSLNSIVPINKEKIISFANAMGQVSGKMVWGVVKLGLIAVPAILATTAANRLVSISKSLNALIPVNPAKIMLFATSMGMVSSKMLWGMVKLGLMAIPAMPAVSAANRIAQISKSLNSISPVDLGKIQRFGQSLGKIGGKILWGIGKLALIALPASAAASASSRLVAISKNLAGINPVNTARISQLSKAMSSVGGWAISKLALLSIPASAAASTAKNLSRISMNLMFIAPVNTKKIESLMDAMGSVGGIALGKFALLSIPAKKALNTATDLMNLSKNLNSIVPVNIVKIMMLNSVMAIASKLKSNVKVLGDMALSAGKASMSATYLLLISKNLSALKIPNVAAVAVFGQSLGTISGKVMLGVIKLGLLVGPLALANKAAYLLATTSKNLGAVKTPNITAIGAFGSTVAQISFKVMFGVMKLALLAGPLALANISAKLIVKMSETLVSGAKLAARGVATISRTLKTITPINAKAIMDLAKVVNNGGSLFFKGIMKWFMLSAFMGPAVRSIANVSKIFLSLNAVGGVNGPKILATLPVLNKMAGSLTSFAGIGLISPLLVGASIAVRILGQSLGTAASGFSTFTKVPWSMMNSAAKSMTEVVSSLNGVANKVAISPNLSALARTFYVLGLAMRSVSTGFSSTARAMAEFNTQSERLKVNTGKAEITARVSAAGAVTEKGAASGTRRPAAVFSPTAPAAAEKIMIAPIEINLKLNGMQIQKLITEANFYRT